MTEPARHETFRRDVVPRQRPQGPATVFARQGAAWSEVTPLPDGRFRIRLGGLFRTAWMAAVCGSLAERLISIEQAHARISRDGSWIAELTVTTLDGAPDPCGLPYLSLAEREGPRAFADLALESYELRQCADYGGTLLLSIKAKDCLGLLGGLLTSLAQLGLFPVEMHIETRGEWASDRLWLGAPGGALPSESTQAALDRLLGRAVIG